MAAGKKHDNDNGRSDRVVRRATSPVVQASVGRGNSQSVASVRHLNGSGNRQQFMASARNGGRSDIRQFSSGNLASVSPRHGNHVVTSARRSFSDPAADTRIARSQLAARSTNDSRVLRASGVNHIDRRNLAVSSSSPSVRSFNSSSSPDVRSFSSSSRSPGVRSSGIARYDRDRADYSQRHEHHSSDWYRSNGWNYDYDYWRSYHHHRYFNDALGVYIIDNFGPEYAPYGYGYDAAPYGSAYNSGYGYGYSEPMYLNSYTDDYQTAAAVQDALAQEGYYNGPIDGIVGPGTRAAISNYQADSGLIITGMIDDSLVRSLGLY